MNQPPANHRKLSTQQHNQQVKKPSSSHFGFFSFGALFRQPSSPPPFSPPERRTTFRLQDYLPQAVEDRTIAEAAAEIQQHLESHVNYFYHFKMLPSGSASRPHETKEPLPRPGEPPRQPAGNPPSARSPTASMSPSNTGLSKSGQMVQQGPALVDERRHRAKVHCLIAERLIETIQPMKEGEHAVFLPKELTVMLSALPLPKSMEDDQAFTSALSQWRVLSWYLLHHKTVREANVEDFQKALDEDVERVLESLERDLEPYVDESSDDKRKEHLRNLMQMTAGLGRLIASQAAVFEFSWDYEPEDDRDSQREIAEQRDSRSNRESHHAVARSRRSRSSREATVLFPALLKTTGHNGIRLTKPVCVCEPQTERLKARPGRRRTEEIH